MPDLQRGAVVGVHAHHVQQLAGQVGLDLDGTVVGRLDDPQLAGRRRALPLVDAGAIADATAVEVQHLAGKAVLDAVDAVAGGDEVPLLPLGIDIVPQLDLSAVVDVIVSHFHDFAVGSADGIELTVGKHGLGNFLSGCHIRNSS